MAYLITDQEKALVADLKQLPQGKELVLAFQTILFARARQSITAQRKNEDEIARLQGMMIDNNVVFLGTPTSRAATPTVDATQPVVPAMELANNDDAAMHCIDSNPALHNFLFNHERQNDNREEVTQGTGREASPDQMLSGDEDLSNNGYLSDHEAQNENRRRDWIAFGNAVATEEHYIPTNMAPAAHYEHARTTTTPKTDSSSSPYQAAEEFPTAVKFKLEPGLEDDRIVKESSNRAEQDRSLSPALSVVTAPLNPEPASAPKPLTKARPALEEDDSEENTLDFSKIHARERRRREADEKAARIRNEAKQAAPAMLKPQPAPTPQESQPAGISSTQLTREELLAAEAAKQERLQQLRAKVSANPGLRSSMPAHILGNLDDADDNDSGDDSDNELNFRTSKPKRAMGMVQAVPEQNNPQVPEQSHALTDALAEQLGTSFNNHDAAREYSASTPPPFLGNSPKRRRDAESDAKDAPAPKRRSLSAGKEEVIAAVAAAATRPRAAAPKQDGPLPDLPDYKSDDNNKELSSAFDGDVDHTPEVQGTQEGEADDADDEEEDKKEEYEEEEQLPVQEEEQLPVQEEDLSDHPFFPYLRQGVRPVLVLAGGHTLKMSLDSPETTGKLRQILSDGRACRSLTRGIHKGRDYIHDGDEDLSPESTWVILEGRGIAFSYSPCLDHYFQETT